MKDISISISVNIDATEFYKSLAVCTRVIMKINHSWKRFFRKDYWYTWVMTAEYSITRERLLSSIGYIAPAQALAKGFTHHGKYYGIPIWIAPENPDCPVVCKWAPMELLFSAAMFIEQTLRPMMFPDEEPVFQFGVGDLITLDRKENP
jgi:hypothetical protein